MVKTNYNSAPRLLYNVAHDLPIEIRDREYIVRYNYIDDICIEFLKVVMGENEIVKTFICHPTYDCSLGHLADLLYSFKESRNNCFAPSIKNEFEKKLYATYLSYLPTDKFSYSLDMHVDDRGSFTEFLKTPFNGQVSVNVGHPGITKGNHYHQTKNEKFLTVSGKCSIKFRRVGTDEVVEYIVSGDKIGSCRYPDGYTHSITNVENRSVTIMWPMNH